MSCSLSTHVFTNFFTNQIVSTKKLGNPNTCYTTEQKKMPIGKFVKIRSSGKVIENKSLLTKVFFLAEFGSLFQLEVSFLLL